MWASWVIIQKFLDDSLKFYQERRSAVFQKWQRHYLKTATWAGTWDEQFRLRKLVPQWSILKKNVTNQFAIFTLYIANFKHLLSNR